MSQNAVNEAAPNFKSFLGARSLLQSICTGDWKNLDLDNSVTAWLPPSMGCAGRGTKHTIYAQSRVSVTGHHRKYRYHDKQDKVIKPPTAKRHKSSNDCHSSNGQHECTAETVKSGNVQTRIAKAEKVAANRAKIDRVSAGREGHCKLTAGGNKGPPVSSVKDCK